MAQRPNSLPRTSPPLWAPHPGGCPRLTGATPTPRHKLATAAPFVRLFAPPPQVAYVPAKLSYWLNNQTGDCVTAEEAFAKACYIPEIFIPDAEVGRWAQAGGYYDGAMLDEVLDSMYRSGFQVGSQLYNDGAKASVDFMTEAVLQAAIAEGPVKVSIDSSALPSGAGNDQGWYAVGNGTNNNQDHCVGLGGYGTAEWLYKQLGVAMPSALVGMSGYLLFTWSTLGFVDFTWVRTTLGEAWVRHPTTVGVPPLPAPNPPAPLDWIP